MESTGRYGIKDHLVVSFMQLFSGWNTIRPFEISMHRAENKKAFAEYRRNNSGRYIEDQERLSSLRYGHRSTKSITSRTVGEGSINDDGSIRGRANTCQLIAIYNALTYLGAGISSVSLAGIIEHFENRGAVINACMGSSPKAAARFLKELGYEVCIRYACSMDTQDYLRMQSDYETYILLAYNNGSSVMGGLHVMSITRNAAGGFERHNDGTGSVSVFPDLKCAACGYNGGEGRPLLVTGIRRKGLAGG